MKNLMTGLLKKTPTRHPADLRIQLLLNWSSANILLSLIGMCLQFKCKVGTPGVLHTFQKGPRCCSITHSTSCVKFRVLCGSDR